VSKLATLLDLPRYDAIALRDPQQDVEVWLRGLNEPINVTSNNVVAALRPFTIGIMLPRHDTPPLDKTLQLAMHQRGGSKRLLGAIYLRPARSLPLPGHQFCLFETTGCENYCVSAPGLRLYYLRERWRAEIRKRKNPYNFQMTRADLRASYVFYLCPRPVVLVSVEHEQSSNIFPMDLIGPTDSPWYSMALRSTSPAVRLMQQSRRMALASIPFTYKAAAYELSKHHKQAGIDWSTLPFPTMPSALFGLRVPEAALRVREVRVQEVHEIGSHTLFLTSVERETAGADGLQLFHSFRRPGIET
jgi:flavin reductase (DIM6/NTAB) family NADH-FMN oxidoreductase RutF